MRSRQPIAPRTISDNGRFVVFVSAATNLVANDTNGVADVFRHDNQTGTTIRVSVTNGGGQIAAESVNPVLSGDADHVAFVTAASLEPADTNTKDDVYVRNLDTGTTQRVSIRPDGTSVVRPDSFSAFGDVSMSRDGRFVAMLNSCRSWYTVTREADARSSEKSSEASSLHPVLARAA